MITSGLNPGLIKTYLSTKKKRMPNNLMKQKLGITSKPKGTKTPAALKKGGSSKNSAKK